MVYSVQMEYLRLRWPGVIGSLIMKLHKIFRAFIKQKVAWKLELRTLTVKGFRLFEVHSSILIP